MVRSQSARIGLLVLVWVAVAGTAPALAQYFGRNKVQYEQFAFKTLKTAHFDIYYYPQEETLAQQVARMAERWNDRLERVLDHRLSSRQPLVLYASHPHFEQTNVIPGFLGEGTGGVTEGLRRRIVLPAGASLAETDHVVGHELVHAFQYDVGSRNPQRAAMLPLWFVEGMAEYLSLGPDDPHTAMWMRDAVLSEHLPTIKELGNPKYFPYRYGQALWAYLASRFGDRVVGDALFAGLSGDAVGTIESITGTDEKDLSKQWHEMLRTLYASTAKGTERPAAIGTPLITEEGEGGKLNIAPALSPDGQRLVFMSERSIVSIDMYLADANTGKILRKLISTAADPHFDSLQFINSAGSWDAAGKRFAFGAIRKGRPYLAILDVDRGRIEREIPFKELGEIYHPTWAPDGKRIAFSAIAGGLSDLYIYDLAAKHLTKLTSDAYADLQPAWSPDGRTIAYVTDRYTTDLKTLAYRSYRLALIDVETHASRELPSMNDAKHIVPQWSGDGRTLFFLSDRTGITNVYRLDVSGSGTTPPAVPVPLTNISTGVTGITSLSPALSVAARTGRLAFSAYHNEHYEIYTIESATTMTAVQPIVASTSVVPESVWAPPGVPAASLNSPTSWSSSLYAPGMSVPPSTTPAPVSPGPPGTASSSPGATPMGPSLLAPPRSGAEVPALLKNATRGLPPEDEKFEKEDYKAKLHLDYVGQPYVVAGADRFGTFVGGGVSFLLSDMLGDHTLAAMAQINGEFDTFAGQLGYINRKSRWNWGAVVEQIPYITGRFGERLDTVEGEPVIVQQVERFNQIHRQVGGVVAYPFSSTKRMELTGGFRQISFNRRIDEATYSLRTGQFLGDARRELAAPGTVNLVETGAALVYDTSLFGPTSPILGHRYRVEVEPTVGDLYYTSLLVDFRQYIMPVKPITLAGRLLHYGRYGSASDDIRLTPLYLGYPHLVRGYDFGSFRIEDCHADDHSRCPEFDRLVGSRLLVANAEIRFPVLGLLKRDFVYGPVPIEGVIFGDAGVAWTRDKDPLFAGGDRHVVRSVGVGARINALGFAIVEVDAVRPLDRPGRGWMFAFNFIPGF